MKITNQNLRKINPLDFVPEKVFTKTGSFVKLHINKYSSEFQIKTNHTKKKIFLPYYINLHPLDFCGIGIYFAEGEKHTKSPGKTKHMGSISIVNSNSEALNPFCNLLKKLNVSSKELKFKIGLNINFRESISEEKLITYWTKLLNLNHNNKRPNALYFTGKKSNYRNIGTSENGFIQLYFASTVFRSFFLNLINNIFDICLENEYKNELSLILKGFFAGDGSVSYSKKPRRKQVDFLNKDLVLLQKIRKSLKILGLKSIKETWPTKTKVNSKALRIYNYHDYKILQKYEILDLIGYKKKTFKKLMASYKNTPKNFFKIK